MINYLVCSKAGCTLRSCAQTHPTHITNCAVHVRRDLKVALLLNIARAYSAQSDFATSAKACSASLSVNPSSAKALYLRGKALVAPASAGAFETEEAIK